MVRASLFNDIESIEYVAAYMTNAAGVIGVWNGNMHGLLGYTADEVSGTKEKQIFLDPFEKSILGGVRFSWRKHKDGTHRFVQETVVEITDIESEFRFMKVLEDLTSQLNLQEKCELWFQHYDGLNESVMVSNRNTFCFQYITEKCAQMWGYDKSSLEGTSFFQVLVPEMNDKDLILDVADSMVRIPQNMMRVPCVKKDGSGIYCLAAATYLEEEDGKYKFYLNHLVPASPEAVAEISDIL